jgi:hypothetical protein
VTDVLYSGITQTTTLHTSTQHCADIPANTTQLLFTDSTSGSYGNVGDMLNDVATGSYTDPVTGTAIPGTTTATAQAQFQSGVVSDSTADITDTESITGTGLQFSLDSYSSVIGSSITAPLNYVLKTATTGPVDWDSGMQSDTGSVQFNKTIDLAPLTVTTGTLTDTANLVGSSGFTASSGLKSIPITSSANDLV